MGGEKIGSEARGAPVSGYCGFQAGVSAGNVFGADFVKTQSLAAEHESALEAGRAGRNPAYISGSYLRESTQPRQFADKAPYPEVLRNADRRIAKYGGFVPGISAENVFAKTFCDSQDVTVHQNKLAEPAPPNAEAAWWAKTKANAAPIDGKQKVGYGGFVPRLYAENIHGSTFAEVQKVSVAVDEQLLEASRHVDENRAVGESALLAATLSTEDHTLDKHLPGYGGYVPAIYAKNVFGATFENAQKMAESVVDEDHHPTATANFENAMMGEQPNAHITTVQMEGKVKISGYAGFVPKISADNLCGENWENAQFTSRGELPTKVVRKTPKIVDEEQLATHTTLQAREQQPETHKIPGYAGYVDKIYAQNIYGRTFEKSQAIAEQNV